MGDEDENVRRLYEEVCKAVHQTDDFRARLLALLPLSSGVGIFLLLQTSEGNEKHLTPIGIFGAAISFGLGLYEARQTVLCSHLVRVGAKLEEEMGFRKGQFCARPHPPAIASWGNLWHWHNLLPSMPLASIVVYATVIAGWIYLAAFVA